MKDLEPYAGELLGLLYTGLSTVSPPDQYDPTSGPELRQYSVIARHYLVQPSLAIHENAAFWTGFNLESQNDYNINPEFKDIDDAITRSIHRQIACMKSESFESILKNLLHNSMVYGCCVAEKVWEYDEEWMLVDIKSKAPFEFYFWDDGYDNLSKVDYLPNGIELTEEDIEKLIIKPYPYLADGNWYGRSMLQPVKRLVEILNLLEESQAKSSQLLAVRPIIHWYEGEQTDEKVKSAQKKLFDAESGSVLSFQMDSNPKDPEKPFKYDEVEVMEDRASDKGLEQIRYLIELYQKMIPRTLGIPDDVGLAATNFGSFAKAKESMSMFMSIVVSNQNYVAKLVNDEIIPAMTEYNYPNLPERYKLPAFNFNVIEEDYLKTLTQSITMLIQAGVINSKERFIRDRLGIPQREVSVENEKPPEVVGGMTEDTLSGSPGNLKKIN